MTLARAALLAFLLATPAASALAANSAPQPLPIVDAIPAPRDVAYPGTIKLDVDATDTVRGIFKVRETIPVSETGPLTLLYPKWLPGNHSPSGPIAQLTGLTVSANGRTLNWTRDKVDVTAFHVDVPAGAKTVEVQFLFVSATAPNQGRVVMTPAMLNLEWNTVALYPAGYFVRQVPVSASVTYPSGWKDATALRPASRSGSAVTYQTVSLDTLVDSPVFAGLNYRREQLSDKVALNIFADRPEQLAASPEQIAPHRRLVEQAVKTFGAQHYDHYDFLFALSDRQSGVGLEHHRSSENGVGGDYFTDWETTAEDRDLLSHEYTHSWDGKYRRGADLWTPDFRTPMQDSLLWVYEGQTQFWGYVLAARSGLWSKDVALDALAFDAAYQSSSAGRSWRSVEDTTNDPIINQRRPLGWRTWQRAEDYYVEGALTWLDADAVIRAQTGGKKSIDDFARAFFGVNDGDWGELTYTFDDVVKTLNGVVPYDWATFLNDRIYAVAPKAPLAWVGSGGYRLDFAEKPGPYWSSREKGRKILDLSYSGGLIIGKEGEIASVLWDSPAFDAGLTVSTKIMAVNGRAYDNDAMKDAVKAAKGGKQPIELIVRTGDQVRTVELKWNGGLRYPTLVKVGAGTGNLDRLLAPRT